MHATAIDAKFWLGHEGRVKTMLTGNRFDDQFKDLDVVAGFQDVGIFEVDFVLTNGYFMVTGFDFETNRSADAPTRRGQTPPRQSLRRSQRVDY